MALARNEQAEHMISDQEMLDLANKFLLAIQSRNWDLLRLIITKDCVWRWPGRLSASGMAVGADAVIQEISEMASRVLTIKLRNVFYGASGVALSLSFHVVMSGVESDEELVTVCILRGYQISGINTYVAGTDNLEQLHKGQ